MATIRLFVVLLLLCCFTAKASTNGEQTYRLLFKSGDVIWIGQDIGGEYELSMLHQVTVTDKGAADGQSMLRAYGNWTFAADLKNVFRTDLVMALKPLDDHAWGHSDLDWTVRAPATDASLTEQFFAHVHDGGSNAQTFYAAQKSPTKHPPAVSVKAALLLSPLDHGLFFIPSTRPGTSPQQAAAGLYASTHRCRRAGYDARIYRHATERADRPIARYEKISQKAVSANRHCNIENHRPRLPLDSVFNTLIQLGFVLDHRRLYPLGQRFRRPLTVYLAAVNVESFLVYGYDKSLACRQKFRVSERTLHLWSLAGGTPGAIAGQLVFRHKINKLRFQLILDIILIAQAAAICWLFLRNGSPISP